MRAYERLLNYVKVWTDSDETTGVTPSSARQFDLANILVEEMKTLGISDAHVDEKCYVYGTIPPTRGQENAVKLGFIAHLDTAPDFTGKNVNATVIENYDGKDVVLGNSGRVIKVSDFPYLADKVGKTLIVTDGTTLLGGDDKAGIADILTMVERLNESGVPHGKICIAFTPDEEIGEGADHFDVAHFGADLAYTVDGGASEEIEYENFNASSAVFRVTGVNIHPGSAKDKMVNAQLVAMEINSMLPESDIPARTEGYEGFYHLTDMSGDVAHAELKYIVRDHDFAKFEARNEYLREVASKINAKYGEGTAELTVREQYRNMAEKIAPVMHLIDNAKSASEEAGLVPKVVPIRGGTDGARLSYMGLPCPNLGTGGSYACHGPFEHAVAEDMDDVVNVLLGIVKRYTL